MAAIQVKYSTAFFEQFMICDWQTGNSGIIIQQQVIQNIPVMHDTSSIFDNKNQLM